MGDDNKKLFSDRRFETFKKKYGPYKEIFELNKKSIKYANWHFEQKLLGYSYSHNIREIYENPEEFQDSDQVKQVIERSNVRFTGVLVDSIRRTSQNGNKYARFEIHDEKGVVNGLLLDSSREERLTNFLNSGKKLPKKEDVVIITGVKGDDIVFVNNISSLKDKIYMKLSQLK